MRRDGYNQHEAHCTFTSVQPKGAAWTVKGNCAVEGDKQPLSLTLSVAQDRLTMRDQFGARALRRCGSPTLAQADQPSWCAVGGTRNEAEKTICASQKLRTLDVELSRVFQVALKASTTDVARQQQWIRSARNGCDADAACLTDMYTRRIQALKGKPPVCKSEPGCPCVNGRQICH